MDTSTQAPFTMDELLLEMERQRKMTPEGFFRTEEIAKAMNHSRTWVCARLKELMTQGRIEVARVPIEDVGMRRTSTWGYRLVKRGSLTQLKKKVKHA